MSHRDNHHGRGSGNRSNRGSPREDRSHSGGSRGRGSHSGRDNRDPNRDYANDRRYSGGSSGHGPGSGDQGGGQGRDRSPRERSDSRGYGYNGPDNLPQRSSSNTGLGPSLGGDLGPPMSGNSLAPPQLVRQFTGHAEAPNLTSAESKSGDLSGFTATTTTTTSTTTAPTLTTEEIQMQLDALTQDIALTKNDPTSATFSTSVEQGGDVSDAVDDSGTMDIADTEELDASKDKIVVEPTSESKNPKNAAWGAALQRYESVQEEERSCKEQEEKDAEAARLAAIKAAAEEVERKRKAAEAEKIAREAEAVEKERQRQLALEREQERQRRAKQLKRQQQEQEAAVRAAAMSTATATATDASEGSAKKRKKAESPSDITAFSALDASDMDTTDTSTSKPPLPSVSSDKKGRKSPAAYEDMEPPLAKKNKSLEGSSEKVRESASSPAQAKSSRPARERRPPSGTPFQYDLPMFDEQGMDPFAPLSSKMTGKKTFNNGKSPSAAKYRSKVDMGIENVFGNKADKDLALQTIATMQEMTKQVNEGTVGASMATKLGASTAKNAGKKQEVMPSLEDLNRMLNVIENSRDAYWNALMNVRRKQVIIDSAFTSRTKERRKLNSRRRKAAHKLKHRRQKEAAEVQKTQTTPVKASTDTAFPGAAPSESKTPSASTQPTKSTQPVITAAAAAAANKATDGSDIAQPGTAGTEQLSLPVNDTKNRRQYLKEIQLQNSLKVAESHLPSTLMHYKGLYPVHDSTVPKRDRTCFYVRRVLKRSRAAVIKVLKSHSRSRRSKSRGDSRKRSSKSRDRKRSTHSSRSRSGSSTGSRPRSHSSSGSSEGRKRAKSRRKSDKTRSKSRSGDRKRSPKDKKKKKKKKEEEKEKEKARKKKNKRRKKSKDKTASSAVSCDIPVRAPLPLPGPQDAGDQSNVDQDRMAVVAEASTESVASAVKDEEPKLIARGRSKTPGKRSTSKTPSITSSSRDSKSSKSHSRSGSRSRSKEEKRSKSESKSRSRSRSRSKEKKSKKSKESSSSSSSKSKKDKKSKSHSRIIYSSKRKPSSKSRDGEGRSGSKSSKKDKKNKKRSSSSKDKRSKRGQKEAKEQAKTVLNKEKHAGTTEKNQRESMALKKKTEKGTKKLAKEEAKKAVEKVEKEKRKARKIVKALKKAVETERTAMGKEDTPRIARHTVRKAEMKIKKAAERAARKAREEKKRADRKTRKALTNPSLSSKLVQAAMSSATPSAAQATAAQAMVPAEIPAANVALDSSLSTAMVNLQETQSTASISPVAPPVGTATSSAPSGFGQISVRFICGGELYRVEADSASSGGKRVAKSKIVALKTAPVTPMTAHVKLPLESRSRSRSKSRSRSRSHDRSHSSRSRSRSSDRRKHKSRRHSRSRSRSRSHSRSRSRSEDKEHKHKKDKKDKRKSKSRSKDKRSTMPAEGTSETADMSMDIATSVSTPAETPVNETRGRSRSRSSPSKSRSRSRSGSKEKKHKRKKDKSGSNRKGKGAMNAKIRAKSKHHKRSKSKRRHRSPNRSHSSSRSRSRRHRRRDKKHSKSKSRRMSKSGTPPSAGLPSVIPRSSAFSDVLVSTINKGLGMHKFNSTASQKQIHKTALQLAKNRKEIALVIRDKKLATRKVWEELGDQYLHVKHSWDNHITDMENSDIASGRTLRTGRVSVNLSTAADLGDVEIRRAHSTGSMTLASLGLSNNLTSTLTSQSSNNSDTLPSVGGLSRGLSATGSVDVLGGMGLNRSSSTTALQSTARNAIVDVFANDQSKIFNELGADFDGRIKRMVTDVVDMDTPWQWPDYSKKPSLPAWPEDIRKIFAVKSRGRGSPDSDYTEGGNEKDDEKLVPPEYQHVIPQFPGGVNQVIDIYGNRLTTDGRRQVCGDLPCSNICYAACNCARTVDNIERYERIWSDMEKAIFVDKFIQFPKNFHRIASFLTNRSTKDCIKFYYDSKTSINYKALLKECDSRRRQMKMPWNQALAASASVGCVLYPVKPFLEKALHDIAEEGQNKRRDGSHGNSGMSSMYSSPRSGPRPEGGAVRRLDDAQTEKVVEGITGAFIELPKDDTTFNTFFNHPPFIANALGIEQVPDSWDHRTRPYPRILTMIQGTQHLYNALNNKEVLKEREKIESELRKKKAAVREREKAERAAQMEKERQEAEAVRKVEAIQAQKEMEAAIAAGTMMPTPATEANASADPLIGADPATTATPGSSMASMPNLPPSSAETVGTIESGFVKSEGGLTVNTDQVFQPISIGNTTPAAMTEDTKPVDGRNSATSNQSPAMDTKPTNANPRSRNKSKNKTPNSLADTSLADLVEAAAKNVSKTFPQFDRYKPLHYHDMDNISPVDRRILDTADIMSLTLMEAGAEQVTADHFPSLHGLRQKGPFVHGSLGEHRRAKSNYNQYVYSNTGGTEGGERQMIMTSSLESDAGHYGGMGADGGDTEQTPAARPKPPRKKSTTKRDSMSGGQVGAKRGANGLSRDGNKAPRLEGESAHAATTTSMMAQAIIAAAAAVTNPNYQPSYNHPITPSHIAHSAHTAAVTDVIPPPTGNDDLNRDGQGNSQSTPTAPGEDGAITEL